MANKIDPYSTHGQKIISLFAKLMFSKDKHSLTDLSTWLRCSKQTVMRLIEIIQRSYGVNVEEIMEGNRKYYRIKKMFGSLLALGLTENELNALHMCRDFTESLLGHNFVQEAARALEKSQTLIHNEKGLPSNHFGTYKPGSIDYTPHQQVIRDLIEAMDKKRVCKIEYRAIMSKRNKTFYIIPLKLFTYYDTMYVDSRLFRGLQGSKKESGFDPLLAVHRIKKIELTDQGFEYPKDYDFEKMFNRSLGVVKEESFQVEVEFYGYSAEWAKERMWSPDQKITKISGGDIKMTFTVSSDWEIIEWLLCFEDEAKLIKPDWLVEKMRDTIDRMQKIYL